MSRSQSAPPRKSRAPKDDDASASLGRLEDLLLTTAQVAQMLHVTPKQVLTFVQTGRLKAHRLPGTRQYLFWRHEIIDLIEPSVVRPDDMCSASEQSVTAEQ